MSPKLSTLVIRDEFFLAHDPGPGHPENAARLKAVYDSLDREPIAGTRTAAPRDVERAELLPVHTAGYLDQVAATAGQGRTRMDPDTYTSAESYATALRAAGATLQATEAVVQGGCDGAFALVRPPGHHAEAATAMGFCLFNNVAVAAEHALRELGCSRVLVLDPDVHHGNGTQHAFWERDDVLFVSSHRFPFYPWSGAIEETGSGAGEGYTLNLPLPAGLGNADFFHVYKQVVEPVAREYAPDLILVSAGFDTWQNDPLGGMKVTGEGFAALFGLFTSWARELCPGRIACVLEGGYDPAGNVAAVRAALGQLTEAAPAPEGIDAPVSAAAREVAAEVARVHSRRWSSLRTQT